MQDHTPTDIRLALLRNGYVPLRNRDKRTFMEQWPSKEITPDVVHSWARMSRDKATGIRVEDGLAVIDFDIDHPIMDEIANAVFDLVPELGDDGNPLLVRRGKGLKEAWFVRTADLFGRVHSAGWTPPGSSADDAVFRVEIFGGGSARQFGAFGPHTVGDDGVAQVMYRWVDASPADTPKQQLPVLTKSQFYQIADMVDRKLADAGWTKALRSTSGEDHAERVYDLTDDMEFNCDDGVTRSLAELETLARFDALSLRCSASWLEGPSAINRSRCLIRRAQGGNVAIHETAAWVTHMRRNDATDIIRDAFSASLAKLQARRNGTSERAKP